MWNERTTCGPLTLAFAIGACALSLVATAQAAGAYPSKPIRFLVPYPPGGSTNVSIRTIGQHLGETWGSSSCPSQRRSRWQHRDGDRRAVDTDGHTLLLGNVSTICINPSLYRKLPFDPVADLQPISLVVWVIICSQ